MGYFEDINRAAKHVYSEPRFVAWIEWGKDHPSLTRQLEDQLGRGALTQFANGGGWENPNARVEFIRYEEPDWDWWEPTSEWRRRDARNREFRASQA